MESRLYQHWLEECVSSRTNAWVPESTLNRKTIKIFFPLFNGHFRLLLEPTQRVSLIREYKELLDYNSSCRSSQVLNKFL